MLTAAICGHRRKPVGSAHTTCIHILSTSMAHADRGSCLTCMFRIVHFAFPSLKRTVGLSFVLMKFCERTMTCRHFLYFPLHTIFNEYAPAECIHVSVCVCMRQLYVCVSVCVRICEWLMNVAGWRQRAMTARLQGNHFFPLRGLLIQSSQEFCWLLKPHHKGAVIITPITASQQRARRVAIKKEIKTAINDISLLVYGGGERPKLSVEMQRLLVYMRFPTSAVYGVWKLHMGSLKKGPCIWTGLERIISVAQTAVKDF